MKGKFPPSTGQFVSLRVSLHESVASTGPAHPGRAPKCMHLACAPARRPAGSATAAVHGPARVHAQRERASASTRAHCYAKHDALSAPGGRLAWNVQRASAPAELAPTCTCTFAAAWWYLVQYFALNQDLLIDRTCSLSCLHCRFSFLLTPSCCNQSSNRRHARKPIMVT